jgi:hypothetical protein
MYKGLGGGRGEGEERREEKRKEEGRKEEIMNIFFQDSYTMDLCVSETTSAYCMKSI